MRAAVLKDFGIPLNLMTTADPAAGAGEVLVDVLATCVLPYTADVFSGRRKYPLEPPVIPGLGAIGRVVQIGPDATQLREGDLVWCDPTVRSRDNALTPDITLQGWSSAGAGGLRLSRSFHHGPFAEMMAIPTENAIPLGDIDVTTAPMWSAISVYLVPYGGLLAVGLQAGETVLVSGASGNFGSAGVATALAMGAHTVVCPGRNRDSLAQLEARFGDRVRTLVLTGRPDQDRDVMAAAAGPIDVVLDLLPPSAPASSVRSAVMAVRPYGRVVLMGGVGMLGGADLALPYPWLMRNCVTVCGQWMYPRTANARMVDLVAAGLLNLSRDSITTFPLESANEAVAYAATHGGPFQRTVLTTDRFRSMIR